MPSDARKSTSKKRQEEPQSQQSQGQDGGVFGNKPKRQKSIPKDEYMGGNSDEEVLVVPNTQSLGMNNNGGDIGGDMNTTRVVNSVNQNANNENSTSGLGLDTTNRMDVDQENSINNNPNITRDFDQGSQVQRLDDVQQITPPSVGPESRNKVGNQGGKMSTNQVGGSSSSSAAAGSSNQGAGNNKFGNVLNGSAAGTGRPSGGDKKYQGPSSTSFGMNRQHDSYSGFPGAAGQQSTPNFGGNPGSNNTTQAGNGLTNSTGSRKTVTFGSGAGATQGSGANHFISNQGSINHNNNTFTDPFGNTNPANLFGNSVFGAPAQVYRGPAGSIWDVCRAVEECQLSNQDLGGGIGKNASNMGGSGSGYGNSSSSSSAGFGRTGSGNGFGNSPTKKFGGASQASAAATPRNGQQQLQTESTNDCLSSVLAVPAILSDQGLQRLAKSLGANLRGSWKTNSSLGQRRPVLIHFRPYTRSALKGAKSQPSAAGNGGNNGGMQGILTNRDSQMDTSSFLESQDLAGFYQQQQNQNHPLGSPTACNDALNQDLPPTRYFIYESCFSQSGGRGWKPRKEVNTASELESFIAAENEKCGDNVLLNAPTRVEIVTGVLGVGENSSNNAQYFLSNNKKTGANGGVQVGHEIQIMDLPAINNTGGISGSGLGGASALDMSMNLGGSMNPQSAGPCKWPSWVQTLSRGKPVIVEPKDVENINTQQGCGQDYFVLPLQNLGVDNLSYSSSSGTGGMGGFGTTQDSIATNPTLQSFLDSVQLVLRRAASGAELNAIGCIPGTGIPATLRDCDNKDPPLASAFRLLSKAFQSRLGMLNTTSMGSNENNMNLPLLLELCQKFSEARGNLIQYLVGYHERCFCNKIAPELGTQLQKKMLTLEDQRRYVLTLDRSAETAIILARNAGASVAACTLVLIEGSIRQNYQGNGIGPGFAGGMGGNNAMAGLAGGGFGGITGRRSVSGMLRPHVTMNGSGLPQGYSNQMDTSGPGGNNNFGNYPLPGQNQQDVDHELALIGLTLQTELELFGKQHPDLQLPHKGFTNWSELGQYYVQHKDFQSHFFDVELSGGAALGRLLVECQASALFAQPMLPDTMTDVKQYLKRELSQCGGVGISSTTWQDVVTKLFQNSTHKVLQSQITYTVHRLEWFLKRQKHSVLQWMLDLDGSSDSAWYSRLYSTHGELLAERREIRRAVFRAYDDAITTACERFGKIFQQMLSAIYNNPNSFLTKQVLSQSLPGGDACDEERFCEEIMSYIGKNGKGKDQVRWILYLLLMVAVYKSTHRQIVLRLNPSNTAHTKSIKRRLLVDSKSKTKEGYSCVVGRNPAVTTETVDDNRVSGAHFAISFSSAADLKKEKEKKSKKGKNAATMAVDDDENAVKGPLHIILSDMSTNGTYLNDRRLGKNTNAEVHIGDRISVLQGKEVNSNEQLWYIVEDATPLDIREAEDGSGMDVDMVGGGAGGTLNAAQDSNPVDGNNISGGAGSTTLGNTSGNSSGITADGRELLEPDPQKRLKSAMSRVRNEMMRSKKTVEVLKKLDRKFDSADVESVLNDATCHILGAFSHIRGWLSRNIPLFAAAFLVKPLSHLLLDEMHKLDAKGGFGDSREEELRWRDHATLLDKVEGEMRSLQVAGELLRAQQRCIMRRRESLTFGSF